VKKGADAMIRKMGFFFIIALGMLATTKLPSAGTQDPTGMSEPRVFPAACNQAMARRCDDDAQQCLLKCKEPNALTQRCQDQCAWALRSCKTMAGC